MNFITDFYNPCCTSTSTCNLSKSQSSVYGTVNIGLPYIIDLMKDTTPQDVVSIQLWMMLGSDMIETKIALVSTGGKYCT